MTPDLLALASEIDRLWEATQAMPIGCAGDWEAEEHRGFWEIYRSDRDEVAETLDREEAELIVSLHNAWPALKQALLGAQAQEERVKEWQPIESAPKDGTSFLSCNMNQGAFMAVAWWSSAYKYFVRSGGHHLYQFTHWMPLPESPDALAPQPEPEVKDDE
jgi:hypothetical protein